MSQNTIDGLVKIAVIILTGVAEYLHLVPSGSLLPVVTLVVGYHAGQNIPSAVTNFLTGKDSPANGSTKTPNS